MNWISKAFSYVRALIDGSLRSCERCSAFTQVMELGEHYDLHFYEVSKGRDIQKQGLLPNIARLRLCMKCNVTVERNLKLHVDCCPVRQDLRVVR